VIDREPFDRQVERAFIPVTNRLLKELAYMRQCADSVSDPEVKWIFNEIQAGLILNTTLKQAFLAGVRYCKTD